MHLFKVLTQNVFVPCTKRIHYKKGLLAKLVRCLNTFSAMSSRLVLFIVAKSKRLTSEIKLLLTNYLLIIVHFK